MRADRRSYEAVVQPRSDRSHRATASVHFPCRRGKDTLLTVFKIGRTRGPTCANRADRLLRPLDGDWLWEMPTGTPGPHGMNEKSLGAPAMISVPVNQLPREDGHAARGAF